MYCQGLMPKLDVSFGANWRRREIAQSHWYLLTVAEQPLSLSCSLLSFRLPIMHCKKRGGGQLRADLGRPEFASISYFATSFCYGNISPYQKRKVSIILPSIGRQEHLSRGGSAWGNFLNYEKGNTLRNRLAGWHDNPRTTLTRAEMQI